MGGSIRVVVKVDERLFVATLHTNGLPYFIFNSKFIDTDKTYIQEFLDSHQFIEHNTANAVELAPYGYGLDIYDFDSRNLYTMQSYCSYQHRHYASYSLDIAHDKEQLSLYDALWNKKYMGLYLIKDMDKGLDNPDNKILHTVDDMSLREAAKSIAKDGDNYFKKRKNVYLFFDMLWEQSGWHHNKYSEDYQGAKDFFESIFQQYPLTDEDILAWHTSLENFEIGY